jgi:putative ABC transport system permease protein
MLKNYFRVAFRNFWRNKTFSLINVFGLAVGISAALVIYLIVEYDFSFDKFHQDGDRIYRVVSNFRFSGEEYHNSGVTAPMGNAARKELTGVELVVPLRTSDDIKVSIPSGGTIQPVVFKKQKNLVFADDAYFRLIHYQWLAGSRQTALQQPYQAVLTEKKAKLYFPALEPAEIMGRSIDINDTVRVVVSGIVQDIHENTDFTFGIFVSRATLENTRLKPHDWDEWNNTNSASQLLLKLAPGTPVKKIEQGLYKLYDKYRNKKDDNNSKDSTGFALQQLADIHFNSNYDNFDQRLAHKPTLYGLLAVAAFLLLLGCINFINLTTAQSIQRAKEIGIRKTMGSSKKQLITQFLSETFLITSMATLLSIAIAPLLLKIFADFIPEGLQMSIFRQPGIALFLIGLIIVVTLLSGFYPALVLSGFKPVLVLKNQAYSNTGKTRNAFLRKTLTISQFVIAQVFIIAAILVSRQISYSLNKDLGFKKDAIVYINTSYYSPKPNNKFVLMDKLKAIPEIAMISLSNNPPSSNNTWSSGMKYKDGKKEQEIDVQLKMIDTNFLSLYKIKLLAGGNIDNSDTPRNMIINETFMKVLGFTDPAQAIGKMVEWNNKQLPVIGVVANFHQKSLHEVIKPLALTAEKANGRTINIALQPQNASGTVWKTAIAKIENAWKEVYPEDDFEYHFLDESIAKYYTAEKHISSLLLWATGLAISISCLGLLGLVIYITNQRTKEIGIRKVIGASIGQLVALLSKDFLLLVGIAFLIAVPIAWWGAHTWLQNFAYKTALSWWIFISGGLIMFLTAMVILGIRTFKAASANPVESLRME